jgi:hypothetical protein
MEGLEQVSDFPTAGNGFLDIFEGTLKGRKVAIEVLRTHMVEELIKLEKVLSVDISNQKITHI